MAWLSRVNWLNSEKPVAADLNNIGSDIRTWGDNVNANGKNLSGLGTLTQDAWTAPTLLASWANFGGAWQPAGYTKDKQSRVWLRGTIAGGTLTVGTVVFTLPAGYRPAASERFLLAYSGGHCWVDITSAGAVTLAETLASGTFLSLAGVSFSVL